MERNASIGGVLVISMANTPAGSRGSRITSDAGNLERVIRPQEASVRKQSRVGLLLVERAKLVNL